MWKLNSWRKWIHELYIVVEDDVLEAVFDDSFDNNDDEESPYDLTDRLDRQVIR